MGTCEKYPVKRIVILGANGQIGSYIYGYLRKHFPEILITACVREIPAHVHCNKYTIFHPFADDWQQLGKTDVLINCIGIIKETKNFSFEQAHIGLTRLMLQNRHLLGNPKIIQISALGAARDSRADFLSTKGEADELLLRHSRAVVVRPSIVCTPDTVFAQKLKLFIRMSQYLMNRLPFPEHTLQTRIQPIMPEDLAAIVTKLCFTDYHPAIVNAVGPDEISLQELIQLTNKHISLIPICQAVADPCIKFVAAVMPDLINRQQYELLLQHNIADTRPVESLLGRVTHSTKEFWHNS